MKIRVTVVVKYQLDDCTGHTYFQRDADLPFVPREGDLLLFDEEERGDPPCPGLRVKSVSWSVRDGLSARCQEWFFLGAGVHLLPVDEQISFRLILGLMRCGFATRDDDLLETCREMEVEWQSRPGEDDDEPAKYTLRLDLDASAAKRGIDNLVHRLDALADRLGAVERVAATTKEII